MNSAAALRGSDVYSLSKDASDVEQQAGLEPLSAGRVVRNPAWVAHAGISDARCRHRTRDASHVQPRRLHSKRENEINEMKRFHKNGFRRC